LTVSDVAAICDQLLQVWVIPSTALPN